MTNINRLKLELANKQYFTDSEFTVFLDENGLVAEDTYNKSKDNLALLNTVLAILQAMQNNIELYCSLNTEFLTKGEAYTALTNQIDSLNKRIQNCADYTNTAKKTITYLFSN